MKHLACSENKALLILLLAGTVVAGCGGGGGGGSKHNGKPPTDGGPDTGETFGLASRPANTACVAFAAESGTANVSTQRAFSGLSAGGVITGLYQAPNDANHWYATVQAGSLVVFENREDVAGVTQITGVPTVNSSGEGGLLSMAFHPAFGSDNRYVYLSYTAPGGSTGMVSRITRYILGTDNQLTNALPILELNQPANNHNGGNIVFGPDGYLYIGFGDGGGGGDEFDNGQNPNTFHSKILRIDVNNGSPYTVPSSNPYYNSSTHLPEIFAQGFRNPWRWSFDRVSGALYVADVGQGDWEEVDLVTAGQNFGWPILEGNHCYGASSCNTSGFTRPIFEYNHDDAGCSITGGYIYRGSAIPELQGRYVYGDLCLTHVRSFAPGNPAGTDATIAAADDLPENATTFGEGLDGELLVGTAAGAIFRFVRNGVTAEPVVPERLSEHPCFADAASKRLIGGVIPYSINNALWSDGADKQRFFALPDAATISVDSRGDFLFPVGSVLIKNFLHDDRLIETRFLMHHENGWGGYSYEWNDAGTDATLSPGAHTRVIDVNYTHIFPSSAQCFQCHTQATNVALGPETAQFNRDQHYDSTGITSHQLDTLQHVGYFTSNLSSSQRSRVIPALDDVGATVQSRARAYLHSNCSGCHQPNGFPTHMDFRYDTAFADTGLCNINPSSGDLGIVGAKLLTPGNTATSLVYQRMARRDSQQMPPLASGVVDSAALAVMAEWIESLNSCGD